MQPKGAGYRQKEAQCGAAFTAGEVRGSHCRPDRGDEEGVFPPFDPGAHGGEAGGGGLDVPGGGAAQQGGGAVRQGGAEQQAVGLGFGGDGSRRSAAGAGIQNYSHGASPASIQPLSAGSGISWMVQRPMPSGTTSRIAAPETFLSDLQTS